MQHLEISKGGTYVKIYDQVFRDARQEPFEEDCPDFRLGT